MWHVEGDTLATALEVAAEHRRTLQAYLQHRVRKLRVTEGLAPARAARLFDGRLVVELEPRKRPRPDGWDAWRDDVVIPLMSAIVVCHAKGVTGLGALPTRRGRWVPPVSWFVPSAAFEQKAADFVAASEWLERLQRERGRPPGDGASLLSRLKRALTSGDSTRLRAVVQAELRDRDRRRRHETRPAGLLQFLTEAELLEHLAHLYQVRQLTPRDLLERGIESDAMVLEASPRWEDPHFGELQRPTPRQLWDELVEDSRATPLWVATDYVPNPLKPASSLAPELRWVGVPEDQPYLFVREKGGPPIPDDGWVTLQNPGDLALMRRKRAVIAHAAPHERIAPLLRVEPSPFEGNTLERDALDQAILDTRGVFAVQGPPGTGKTYLATQVVLRFLASTPGGRVLVCSKEHFALDHILRTITKGLAAQGTPFRAFRSVSLARLRRGGAVDETWLGARLTQELGALDWTEDGAAWKPYQAETVADHDRRLLSLARDAASLFFCTTMDGAMVDHLGSSEFDLVIVEEAGKCYPSELLHALTLAPTALVIGDQQQLPPYQEERTREYVQAWGRTLGKARRQRDFAESLLLRFGNIAEALLEGVPERPLLDSELAWLRPFERLFETRLTRFRLDEQFRMEAPLSRLIGTVFYGKPFAHRKLELVEAGKLPARPLGDAIPPELDVPLLWIDVPHMSGIPEAGEDPEKRGVRTNAFERDLVCRYLERLGGNDLDLVILTPYRAQKQLLLGCAELERQVHRLTERDLVDVVKTTDEYQGREAELTLLSLVRNNSLGARAWGFMTSLERLNVMFSRTRFRQVVFGCGEHIERHADEAEYLAAIWNHYRLEAEDPRCARIMRPEALDG